MRDELGLVCFVVCHHSDLFAYNINFVDWWILECGMKPWWFGLIYYPIVIFVLSVLFCVSCRDPGLMERVIDEEAAENGWFWNEQVGSYRPAGAMYCRECKALVHDYDHVCPWTGTAIGKGNMKSFKMFVFSVNVLCYLSIGLVIWQVLSNIT